MQNQTCCLLPLPRTHLHSLSRALCGEGRHAAWERAHRQDDWPGEAGRSRVLWFPRCSCFIQVSRSLLCPLSHSNWSLTVLNSSNKFKRQVVLHFALCCSIVLSNDVTFGRCHRKGLIYLDVPIEKDDYVAVPPLEGFVMNRLMGDYLETLLYKVFVSLDDNTSVEEVTSAACESVIDVEQSIILKNWFSHYRFHVVFCSSRICSRSTSRWPSEQCRCSVVWALPTRRA